MAKSKKYPLPPEKSSLVEEEPALMLPSGKTVGSTAFGFKKFMKLANKVPFTQTEWAHMLHVSERTLQRYAKNNSSFEGLFAERILQIQELINMGLETFTDADALYRWLRREKKVLGHTLNFESLYTGSGIQELINEIGRIQHGVYI